MLTAGLGVTVVQSSGSVGVGSGFCPGLLCAELVAYFSHITVVPRLLELAQNPETGAMAEFALCQGLSIWLICSQHIQ